MDVTWSLKLMSVECQGVWRASGVGATLSLDSDNISSTSVLKTDCDVISSVISNF